MTDLPMTLANLGAERAMLIAGQHHRQTELDLVTFDYVIERVTRSLGSEPLVDPGANLGPARHRVAGPTEIDAADLALPKAGTLRWQVLDELFIQASGLTDQEIAERTGKYLYSIAPRRTELVHMGWVRDSGRVRATEHNRDAVVWILTDAGSARMGDHYDGTE